MKDIEKSIRGFFLKNIFVSVMLLILGIVLMALPEISSMVFAYCVGIILITNGICYLLDRSSRILFYDPILMGLMSLIFGVLIFVNPDIFNTIVPILLGIWFLVLGIVKIEIASIINDVGAKGWGCIIATSILAVFSGIFLMLCPKFGGIVVVYLMGLLIVIYSVSDIFNYILIKRNIDKLIKYFK